MREAEEYAARQNRSADAPTVSLPADWRTSLKFPYCPLCYEGWQSAQHAALEHVTFLSRVRSCSREKRAGRRGGGRPHEHRPPNGGALQPAGDGSPHALPGAAAAGGAEEQPQPQPPATTSPATSAETSGGGRHHRRSLLMASSRNLLAAEEPGPAAGGGGGEPAAEEEHPQQEAPAKSRSGAAAAQAPRAVAEGSASAADGEALWADECLGPYRFRIWDFGQDGGRWSINWCVSFASRLQL